MTSLLTHLKQHTWTIGFTILVAVTAYGLYFLFFGGIGWRDSIAHWWGMGLVLMVAMALAVVDYGLEAGCWMWLYSRFGIPVRDGTGFSVYLSGHAGLFVPAQMGRLIRPNAIVRLGRGNLADGVKAEAALFYLDATAALVTVSALAFYWIQPLAVPVVALGVSVSMLFLTDRVHWLLLKTRVSLPSDFWRSRQTFAMLWLLVAGWLFNGLALYALVGHLAEGINPLETVFFATLARMVGWSTGLPGGIGAVEGLLGVSLRIMEVPTEQLLLAVGAYRIVTFWLLLPVGWVALLILNRRGRLDWQSAGLPPFSRVKKQT